jgi:hypothetical protein
MNRFEELKPNAAVRGILPDALATVVSGQWFGFETLEVIDKSPSSKVANAFLYLLDESRLEVVEQGQLLAAFLCPGYPLLDAATDQTLKCHRGLLRRDAVLVDKRDLRCDMERGI